MSSLADKLKENRNRRRREALIASIDGCFRELICRAGYAHDPGAMKFAAFATWDYERDDWTTTRGAIRSWRKLDCSNADELLSAIERVAVSFSGSDAGWLFFEVDGPYYSIAFGEFMEHLCDISKHVASTGAYEFGWVGAERDAGLIVEFEQTAFCKNDLSLCTWLS